MPLVVRGNRAVERGSGKVKKKFGSRAKARAYVAAVNISMARKKGRKIPKRRKRAAARSSRSRSSRRKSTKRGRRRKRR